MNGSEIVDLKPVIKQPILVNSLFTQDVTCCFICEYKHIQFIFFARETTVIIGIESQTYVLALQYTPCLVISEMVAGKRSMIESNETLLVSQGLADYKLPDSNPNQLFPSRLLYMLFWMFYHSL